MTIARTRQVSATLTLLVAVGLAATLGLAFSPAPAEAVVNCAQPSSADTDGDGLSDAVECGGIAQLAGLTLAGSSVSSLPNCASNPAIARPHCVDPDSRDFFVVFVRTNPSLIPANPAQFISQSLSAGGLAVTVHELEEGAGIVGDRTLIVGLSQKYLKVNESLAPATSTDTDLGRGNVGTVNSTFAFATIFTQRIADYHRKVYTDAGNIYGPSPAQATERDRYILHTVAHEIGHNMSLCACPDNPRYGGRHYKTGTFVVMEQSVKVTVQGGNVTFFIAEDYPSADQTGADLN